jgi:hypothetical protein
MAARTLYSPLCDRLPGRSAWSTRRRATRFRIVAGKHERNNAIFSLPPQSRHNPGAGSRQSGRAQGQAVHAGRAVTLYKKRRFGCATVRPPQAASSHAVVMDSDSNCRHSPAPLTNR